MYRFNTKRYFGSFHLNLFQCEGVSLVRCEGLKYVRPNPLHLQNGCSKLTEICEGERTSKLNVNRWS